MWMAGALGEDKEVFDLLFGKNLGLLACHRMIQINAARILNQSSYNATEIIVIENEQTHELCVKTSSVRLNSYQAICYQQDAAPVPC
jgi:hypothetical protein